MRLNYLALKCAICYLNSFKFKKNYTRISSYLFSQLSDQPDHINLVSYFQAVKTYLNAYQEYLSTNDKDCQNKLNKSWLKLGVEQKIIPVWIFKNLLHVSTKGKNKSKRSEGCIAYKHEGGNTTIDLSNPAQRSRLGKDFAIARGKFYKDQFATKGHYSSIGMPSCSVNYDAEVIEKSLEVSKRHISRQIALEQQKTIQKKRSTDDSNYSQNNKHLRMS